MKELRGGRRGSVEKGEEIKGGRKNNTQVGRQVRKWK